MCGGGGDYTRTEFGFQNKPVKIMKYCSSTL